jgi:hypothetical protein
MYKQNSLYKLHAQISSLTASSAFTCQKSRCSHQQAVAHHLGMCSESRWYKYTQGAAATTYVDGLLKMVAGKPPVRHGRNVKAFLTTPIPLPDASILAGGLPQRCWISLQESKQMLRKPMHEKKCGSLQIASFSPC